ncbi:hypothetical protein K8R30_03695 [archaeon]|nr:hypothetical protein [archaeon]
MIDVPEKKRKILEFLETSGPSLPVQVARTIQMDPVFASAILSELLTAREIQTSHMKIGSSPLYLLPNQKQKLEEETSNLKSIEKEAQEKLKSKKVIFDQDEKPAIRVALRNIKDFAIPFKFQNEITWKYAFTPQEEINELLSPKKEIEEKPEPTPDKEEDSLTTSEPEVPKAWEVKKEEIHEAKEKSKRIESIFKEEPTPSEDKKESIKTPKEKSTPPKTFLKGIEQFLVQQDTAITAIEEVDKRKVTAIVESNGTPSMLFAFNKIRINETELLKCYKTANKKNLPYQIIIKGDLTKKLSETISAHQKLIKISKLSN